MLSGFAPREELPKGDADRVRIPTKLTSHSNASRPRVPEQADQWSGRSDAGVFGLTPSRWSGQAGIVVCASILLSGSAGKRCEWDGRGWRRPRSDRRDNPARCMWPLLPCASVYYAQTNM